MILSYSSGACLGRLPLLHILASKVVTSPRPHRADSIQPAGNDSDMDPAMSQTGNPARRASRLNLCQPSLWVLASRT